MPIPFNTAGDAGFADNYLKSPIEFSRFGTRQLDWYYVSSETAFNSSPEAAGSEFTKAVRAIQTQAEIFIVGRPDANGFMVAVATETTNDGENTEERDGIADAKKNGNARRLAQVVSTALGYSVSVDCYVLLGLGFDN